MKKWKIKQSIADVHTKISDINFFSTTLRSCDRKRCSWHHICCINEKGREGRGEKRVVLYKPRTLHHTKSTLLFPSCYIKRTGNCRRIWKAQPKLKETLPSENKLLLVVVFLYTHQFSSSFARNGREQEIVRFIGNKLAASRIIVNKRRRRLAFVGWDFQRRSRHLWHKQETEQNSW